MNYGDEAIIFQKNSRQSHEKSNIQKNITTAFDAAAAGLGNTRTVCKSYYVHPGLIEKYENSKLDARFTEMESLETVDSFMTTSELLLLKIISSYKIEPV